MHLSEWQKRLEAVEKERCEKCHGSGKLDDADPYDISYNEWTCDKCKGRGGFWIEGSKPGDAR